MRIEERVRVGLQKHATEATRDGTQPERLWNGIEHGIIRHRRQGIAKRVGSAAVAFAVFAGLLVWLAPAIMDKGQKPEASPQLSVGQLRVVAAPDVAKIYGVISNDGPSASGASITCALSDATGGRVGTARGTIAFIAPDSTRSFLLGGPTTGVATAAICNASPVPPVSPPPTVTPTPVYQPTSLAFWDAQHGLVAGVFGVRSGTPEGSNLIEATSDGGRSFSIALRTDGPIADVDALDATHAWAVAGPCAMGTCERQMLFSSDGGRTWTRLSNGPFERVSFASATDGWAVGHLFPTLTQDLESTTDGGRTWRSLPVPCPQQASFATDVSFPAPGTGWLLCTGEGGAGNEGKAVLETRDSGRTWRTVAEALMGGSSGSGLTIGGYPTGIFFGETGQGWMWEERGLAFATDDSGTTWRSIGVSQPELNAVTSMWFTRDLAAPNPADLSQGLALRSGGGITELLTSSDGGNTWIRVMRWG